MAGARNTVIKEILSTHDVGRILSVHMGTVIDWVSQGKLPAYRTPGGHRRIRADDLRVFLRKYNMPVPDGLARAREVRVLVVDDDAGVRATLQRFFRARWPGVKVEEAEDGYKAGQKMERFRPDLVILDINLPGMDGFEVCRSIREDARFSDTRVLAVTGQNFLEYRERMLEAGADAFMEKPFSMSGLKDEVEKWLPMRLANSA